jgi:hypothetical protein
VCSGLLHGTEQESNLAVPANLPTALSALGLDKAVGYLWMVPQDVCQLPAAARGMFMPDDGPQSSVYLPYNISLGVPLYDRALCTMVQFFIQRSPHELPDLSVLVAFLAGCSCRVKDLSFEVILRCALPQGAPAGL